VIDALAHLEVDGRLVYREAHRHVLASYIAAEVETSE